MLKRTGGTFQKAERYVSALFSKIKTFFLCFYILPPSKLQEEPLNGFMKLL
jgi:hypothetical protein